MATDGLTLIALQTAQHELEYERVLRRTERICEQEQARILRVKLLLQEDASDELREIAEEHEDALQQSEDSSKEVQGRLVEMEDQYETAQSELKACMRDIDQYQTEINALNLSSSDNTKILTEKLALSRELNALKPELDHLRSQVSHHDNILADKLSLQRELATAQLELDSEKRAIARLKQKAQSMDPALTEEVEELKASLAKERKTIAKLEKQNTKRANEKSTADAALVDQLEGLKNELEDAQQRVQSAEKQIRESEAKHSASSGDATALDELRKDLAKERKTGQKLEREQLKKAAEWDGQKEALESKLDAFRTKLRTTKEQLKEAQDELERVEASKYAESTAATKARMRGTSTEPSVRGIAATQGNTKKRPVARFDPDMTIGTPGNGAQAAKRQRLTGSMLGDKSTFSITPFLNKTTMSILPESPAEAGKDEHDKVDDEINTSINELAEEAEREQETKKTEPITSKKAAEKKATASKPVGDKKIKGPAGRTNSSAKQSSLPKVIEEDGEAEQPPEDQENLTSTTSKPPGPSIAVMETTNDTASFPQPKKKKVLGPRRNIFDDDDAGTGGGIAKKPIGLGVNKVKLGPGNNKPKMLAVFSPLKKDRRGVGMVGA